MKNIIALYGPFQRGGIMHDEISESLKFIRSDTVEMGARKVNVEVFEIPDEDLARFKDTKETEDYKMKEKVLASGTCAFVLCYLPLESEK